MNKGKYVLNQIMDFVSSYEFKKCVNRYGSNSRVRNLSCWDQFLALAFGQLSYQESLRSITVCLSSQKEKIYHLGFSASIARTTLAEANEKRNWKIYRDLARILIKESKNLYCNDHSFNLELDGACYAIDSTIIELCLNIFGWAKLKKVRAAVKLNLQLDLKGNLPAFFDISTAKVADVNFLDLIDYETGAYYIFDRGYVDVERFFKINDAEAYFVTRAKTGLKLKRLYSNPVKKDTGIHCDQIVKLITKISSEKYPSKLRRVKYYDQESKRYFIYLTNNFNIPATTVADLYRHRWQIELFFKWIKQHLKIKTFWGYSENAVKTQICIAICTYLIVAIAKKKLNIDRNLYEILQILNVTLFLKTPLNTLLSEYELQMTDDLCQEQQRLFDF